MGAPVGDIRAANSNNYARAHCIPNLSIRTTTVVGRGVAAAAAEFWGGKNRKILIWTPMYVTGFRKIDVKDAAAEGLNPKNRVDYNIRYLTFL